MVHRLSLLDVRVNFSNVLGLVSVFIEAGSMGAFAFRRNVPWRPHNVPQIAGDIILLEFNVSNFAFITLFVVLVLVVLFYALILYLCREHMIRKNRQEAAEAAARESADLQVQGVEAALADAAADSPTRFVAIRSPAARWPLTGRA